jgi:hypothetical protein
MKSFLYRIRLSILLIAVFRQTPLYADAGAYAGLAGAPEVEFDFRKIVLHSNWMSRDWIAATGKWKLGRDGIGKTGLAQDGLLVYRHPVAGGDVRIEIVAKSERPGDIGVFLGMAPGRDADILGGCAYIGFGCNDNNQSKIAFDRRQLTNDVTVTIVPGKWQTVAFERSGCKLKLEVDGRVVLTADDSKPAGRYLGLYAWNEVTIQQCRIKKGSPVMSESETPEARSVLDPSSLPWTQDRSPAERSAHLYVSPEQGNDAWSGLFQAEAEDGSDGPVRTVAQALRRCAEIRRAECVGPVFIHLAGGVHLLEDTLVIDNITGGLTGNRNPKRFQWPYPTVLTSWGDERATLSGARRIAGFRETRVNDIRAWVAAVPSEVARQWDRRQLWVNGRRAARTRVPRAGFFRVAVLPEEQEAAPAGMPWRGESNRFGYAPGDLDPDWRNLHDVEIVVNNYWIQSRAKIVDIDDRARSVRVDRPFVQKLRDDQPDPSGNPLGAPYAAENVFEALDEPGEWYFDSGTLALYYVPREGESIDNAEAYVPVLTELLRVEGESAGNPVGAVWITYVNLFHAAWPMHATRSAVYQAAHAAPAALVLKNAVDCQIVRCSVSRVGGYAVELAEACWDNEIRSCDMTDSGAGGIKIWHGCHRNRVTGNQIAHGGRLDAAGVGILVGRCMGTQLLRNHIHDFYYTGISVGWNWGYEQTQVGGNIIEYNHIHDIGQHALSDMAGIYTLGVQPGTRIRYNRIHDVQSRTYGGWGIYPDEGSSLLLIENNLCYRCKSGGFHQHYGRDNVVRNNIFAFAEQHQLCRGRTEHHSSFLFEGNIVLVTDEPVWQMNGAVGSGARPRDRLELMHGAGPWDSSGLTARLRHNLYWSTTGSPLRFNGVPFEQWQGLGFDEDSIVADPCFVDPENGDFSFRPESPYGRIGFVPFDLSRTGVPNP